MAKIENPGRYSATVSDVEFGESGTGTPYINLYFSSPEGNIGGWFYLSEKALPGTVKSLRNAFNFDGNFETAKEQIKGKACSITVETEVDDKGVERLRVRWVNAPREVKEIADQDNFLKALSAKAARIPKEAPKAISAPTKAASARPIAKPAPKTTVSVDDAPFG